MDNIRTMKRVVLFAAIALACAICAAPDTNAQENKSRCPHYLLEFEGSIGGHGWTNLNDSNLALTDLTTNIGYRFNEKWSVFVPVKYTTVMSTLKNNKVYDIQSTLGAGGQYQLDIKDSGYFLTFGASAASTILNEDIDYFRGDFTVKWGGYLGGTTKAYLGLGLIYLHPYSDYADKNVLMLGFTLGVALF